MTPTMPAEIGFLLALVGWVAVLLAAAALVDRRRERRRLRAIAERGGRLVDEDDAVAMLANTGLEDES